MKKINFWDLNLKGELIFFDDIIMPLMIGIMIGVVSGLIQMFISFMIGITEEIYLFFLSFISIGLMVMSIIIISMVFYNFLVYIIQSTIESKNSKPNGFGDKYTRIIHAKRKSSADFPNPKNL